MITRQLIAVRSLSLFHALLTTYFLIGVLFIFLPNFYINHVGFHLIYTISLVVTFIIQRIYRGCPITALERNMLAKFDKKEAKAFSNSFIIYYVKKYTGITLPVKFVQSMMYVYLLLLIFSWLYLFIKI